MLFSIGLEGTFNGTLGPFSSNSVKFLTSLTNYGNNFRGRDRRLFYSSCQIPGKPWGLGPWWELVPRVRQEVQGLGRSQCTGSTMGLGPGTDSAPGFCHGVRGFGRSQSPGVHCRVWILGRSAFLGSVVALGLVGSQRMRSTAGSRGLALLWYPELNVS